MLGKLILILELAGVNNNTNFGHHDYLDEFPLILYMQMTLSNPYYCCGLSGPLLKDAELVHSLTKYHI
jgi:hypothetical protein